MKDILAGIGSEGETAEQERDAGSRLDEAGLTEGYVDGYLDFEDEADYFESWAA